MKNLYLLFLKKKKNLLILFILNTAITINSQVIETPYDAEGWSILDVTNVTKIIYVSSSGNDATGETYSSSDVEIGNTPILPTGNIRPFQTISAAYNQVVDGEAAWILLRRGDTFFESLDIRKNGNSLNMPLVYASYGTSNQPPLLKTGANNGIIACCRSRRHIWIIGLSFYAHTRNPNDADYIDATDADGFNFYASANETIENILIEGCTFNFYRSNVMQANPNGNIGNIRFRRNVIRNNYSTQSHSQGFYTSNIKNGILLEDNIFDHNGWFTKSYDGTSTNGQATIFNHNTYFYHTEHAILKGNTFHRPSSIGNKWATNEVSGVNDVTIENNFYNDCEVAISMGGNDDDEPYRFRNISIKDNVITSSGLSQQTNRTLGWNIGINDWDNGEVTKNLILNQTNTSVDNGRGIFITGENRDLTINENILYNLTNTSFLHFRALTNNTNVSIRNNEISESPLGNNFMVYMSSDNYTSLLRNNMYNVQNTASNNFYITGNQYSLYNWIGNSMETGATNTLPNTYPDSSRSFDRYVNEILGLTNRDEYYQNLANMNYLNWDESYTANAINEWIKNGFFENGTLSTINNNQTPLPIFVYPNPGNGIIQIESSVEGNYIVYNQLGQTIQSEKFNQLTEIDLTKQATGIYIINLYDLSNNSIKIFKYLKR